jgi:hypothetical protein
MAKTVPDIVYDIPKWDDKLKTGMYVRFHDQGKTYIGQIDNIDLTCDMGLKYYIRKYKEQYPTWYNDLDIISIYKFKKSDG